MSKVYVKKLTASQLVVVDDLSTMGEARVVYDRGRRFATLISQHDDRRVRINSQTLDSLLERGVLVRRGKSTVCVTPYGIMEKERVDGKIRSDSSDCR